MVTEAWVAVSGYEGLYEVSNLGRIRRVSDHLIRKFGRSKGYFNVSLSKDGKQRAFTVHRLVAIAFLGSPTQQIRHLNGDKHNNTATNLAWGTALENAADREAHGHTQRGILHSRAKRTEEQIRTIKLLASQGLGCAEIGRKIGLDKARVHEVMRGRIWRHI